MINNNECIVPNIEQIFIVRAHTIEEEINYVWKRLKKISFYIKNGYNLSLPKTKPMDNLIEKSLNNELTVKDKSLLEVELKKVYDFEYYQESLRYLESATIHLSDVMTRLKVYADSWQFKLYESYLIKLTRYGPGGSYDSDEGYVIVKVNNMGIASKTNNGEAIVLHEIIHIAIEEIIVKKFNLSHELKERLVDLFISDHFSDVLQNYNMQDRGDKSIDSYINKVEDWLDLPTVIARFVSNNK